MYWKLYNDSKYNFDEVIKLWKYLHEKKMFPAIEVEENYQKIHLDEENIPSNINDIKIPLWAIRSNNWNILIKDFDKIRKLEEIRNYIEYELNYEPDSRFYDENKMDIYDWWQKFDDKFINDDLIYEIIMWLKENKKIKCL